jgi:hypothetical protein
MTYKAFEDYYKEAEIKHLVLFEHNGYLISPPFCTDKCKDYSKVMVYKDGAVTYIDIDTPPATSKYNSMAVVGDSLFFAPYGIWDNFNTVLELKNWKPIYHTIDSSSKGQFYNMASDGVTAFAAPLGYDPVSFGLFIKDGKVQQIPIPDSLALKRHMGCVFANGNYYSAPRGETLDYDTILKFNPASKEVTMIKVDNLPLSKRKYSDFIQSGHKLFALPFGREQELHHVLVLDTITDTTELVELNIPPFMKKYNVGVLLDDVIIAVPYGHKDDGDANYGLVFNTTTYEHSTFDVEQTFGGKYRFRCGVAYNDVAVFFPTGTPNADIVAVNKTGNVVFRKSFPEYILGRPIEYNGTLYTLAYQVLTQEHCLVTLDKDYNINFEVLF